MHFNPQLFKVSIIQTKLFGPLDFELSRFHCIYKNKNEGYSSGLSVPSLLMEQAPLVSGYSLGGIRKYDVDTSLIWSYKGSGK